MPHFTAEKIKTMLAGPVDPWPPRVPSALAPSEPAGPASVGGSAPTPRTDAIDQQARRLVTEKPFGASSADTINEIVALYSVHARNLEVSLVNAYAHGERMAAGWLALRALLARCEATQGQRFYDQVKPEWEAAVSALSSPNDPGQPRET